MPRPSKKVGAKPAVKKSKKTKLTKKTPPKTQEELDLESRQLKAKQDERDNNAYIGLVNTIRSSADPKILNDTFNKILEMMKPQIQYMVNRFNIPGLDSNDIMQEALFALKFKAIKDYDQTRGTGTGPASFKLFALLCIRRHLTTERKSSLNNNRKKILNQSMSLDQDTRSEDGDMSLASIVPSKDAPILESLQKNESYRNLMTTLVKRLSKFEREVLVLYAQGFSYEEISNKINEKRVKIKVDVKGIDNALSRIKHKAKVITTEADDVEQEDLANEKSIDNALERVKLKARKIKDDTTDVPKRGRKSDSDLEDFDVDTLA